MTAGSVPNAAHPIVFVSYSQDADDVENTTNVHRLAASLRRDGVNARIDIAKSTDEDWMMWMERELENADYVLCMVNASYQERFNNKGPGDRGRGVGWEAGLIRRELYDGKWKNERFLPCYFQRGDREYMPRVLEGYDEYLLDSAAGYEKLLRKILGLPTSALPDLGAAPDLQTVAIEPLFKRPGSEGLQRQEQRLTPEPKPVDEGPVLQGDVASQMNALFASLDRVPQRQKLGAYLDETTATGKDVRSLLSAVVVARGREHDSTQSFALCCQSKFAESLAPQRDEKLLELLRECSTIYLRPDLLSNPASTLAKILDDEAERVAEDGWLVLFSKIKSRKTVAIIASKFVEWRQARITNGCRRKVLLALVIEESVYHQVVDCVSSLFKSTASSQWLCEMDRLSLINHDHVLEWRRLLRHREFEFAQSLDRIAYRVFGSKKFNWPLQKVKEEIMAELP